jgi:translocation and assembly module TamB
MSDPESTPPVPTVPTPPDEPQKPAVQSSPQPLAEPAKDRASAPCTPEKFRRLRRFFLRHLPLSLAGAVILLALATVGAYFWASSADFEDMVRQRLVANLESATGGRAEIASFHWHLLSLEAEVDGLVLHGREASTEAPYAQVDHLRVGFSVFNLLSPRILLRHLEVTRPRLHLIVYPDGSTNQPQPRKKQKPGKSALDTLFDLKAGHIAVDQGVLDYDSRAAAFDFQDRYIPLDFAANDATLRMAYALPAGGNPESFHIELGATDLTLARGATPHKPAQAVHGRFDATLDLVRAAAYLRSLHLTAAGHTLEISGTLQNFAQPRWQAKATGDLDMRLLDPVTGYTFAPQGIARLDLAGAGQDGEFRADGTIHVDGGSYIGTGVVETGINLDARVHADPQQLLVHSIVARLRQGGQLEGDLTLVHWLPMIPGAATLRAAPPSGARTHDLRAPTRVVPPPPPSPNDITIPVDGKVTARFRDVSLDTLLDMVGQAPFQRLGLDARLNGPAVAVWTKGDVNTLTVTSSLGLTPSSKPVAGEVPTTGAVEGVFFQRNGSVDLAKLEVHTPASLIEAHGSLGVYPLARPTSIAVDFHSHKLGEFDTVLRDLGMVRNGKSGVAALPIVLAGQGDFHGQWAGALADPRISGTAKATQLSIEIPPANGAAGNPQLVTWDTVEATGSYSAARVEISRGQLQRGKSLVSVDGSLTAAAASVPSFGANSVLHAHARASKVGIEELLPLTGQSLPIAGALDAQFDADGPIQSLNATGWVELDGGTIYGEPVARLRAQGNIANQKVRLTSVTVDENLGKITANGSYDLKSHRFEVDAKGSGIDVARIQWTRRENLAVTGKLAFSVTGSGTFDDPRLEAHATLAGLALGGETIGGLELVAHTANRFATYDASTRLEGAEFVAHGQTALSGDFATQAKLDFSRFNIGALLKMAHVQDLGGESALAGTVTLEGPLKHPENLRGEARLQQLAVTVAGVHLQSEGGVHATLANSLIHLDPLHVTGDETDMHVQGNLALKDRQQLDFAASGAINLKVAQTLDPDLTASGTTTFQVEAHGPLSNPGFRGRIDFQNASISLEDIPNGLSQLHGTLEFNQNRLEVKSLTAMSGGGLLSFGGFLAYQNGLYADLSVTGKGIRIRYPAGVSSQADASFHLQGARSNLLLSGDVLITRFSVSPDLDIAALASQASATANIAPPDAPSNHIRLDVHLASSPQLSFQNAYAKLAGNVDLRLRGTMASPSLLGRVSVTEGSATIAGTRYELQRGDIFFTNPVRIQPNIDLNATARVEDYDIVLGLHGTPQKMAVTYRSDPPLPEADVVALLALGRTENQQRIYTTQQESAGSNPATDALLGGALNATVSSRVQRLFGAGAVKVDPSYLGALGNSTSRITVEEQLGSKVTLTYATNVNTTAQQLLQAEVAINHHVSLLLSRDESGVISMVIKATRRYR